MTDLGKTAVVFIVVLLGKRNLSRSYRTSKRHGTLGDEPKRQARVGATTVSRDNEVASV